MAESAALGWASLGLQAISTLGAATGQARMNRATISGNKKAINLIDKNLSLIPEVGASKRDTAKEDYKLSLDTEMFNQSTNRTDGFLDFENASGSTGFAGDYSMNDAYSKFTRTMDQNLSMKRKSLYSGLDKNLASVSEWEDSAMGTLEAEKLKYENENRVLRTQDKWYENIF